MKINKSFSFTKRANFAAVMLLNFFSLLAGCAKDPNNAWMDSGENYDEKSKCFDEVQIDIAEYKLHEPYRITVKSENLIMRNIEDGTYCIGEKDKSDLDYYFDIFSNPVIMEKYMNGIPRPTKEIITRHQKYFSWWCEGNPFSSYLTFLNESASIKFLNDQENLSEHYKTLLQSIDKNHNPPLYNSVRQYEVSLKHFRDEFTNSGRIFIGHVLLEPGDDRSLNTDAEISYAFIPAFWQRGYATEAVNNIVLLAKEFYDKKIALSSNIIDTLIATARPDNPGSCKTLEKNGFEIFKEEDKFGAPRRLYTLALNKI